MKIIKKKKVQLPAAASVVSVVYLCFLGKILIIKKIKKNKKTKKQKSTNQTFKQRTPITKSFYSLYIKILNRFKYQKTTFCVRF